MSLVSCREEEGVWDELTDDERTALRLRANNKCKAETDPVFDDFKTKSGDAFYGSGAYVPGITFNHIFKEGSATDYTHKVTVWKVTATDVYFLIFVDDSTDIYKFLKIPKTTNETMITELQTRYCDRSDLRDVNFTLALGSKTYKQVRESSTKENIYTFTYSHSLLAFFSVYKETRKERALNTAGEPTGTATTMTGTFSVGKAETNIPEFDTYAEYLAKYPTTTLCVVNHSSIPYDVTCHPAGTGTFPSTEL
jgi:hypothetical protein